MTACPRSGISPRVQFGGHESFEAGENKVDLLVGEVLVVMVVVMEVLVVVNIVGVVGAQREISFEYNIEAEALAEMVEEVEVEKKAEKEPGVVDVMELVGREPAFVDKNWRDLLVGHQSRVVLRTFFWQPLPHCPFYSSDLYWSSWIPAFSFWVFLVEIVVVTNDVGVSADAGTAGDIVFLGVGSTAVGFLVSVFCFGGGEVVPVWGPFLFPSHLSPFLLVDWLG